jgi:hypothetical protein
MVSGPSIVTKHDVLSHISVSSIFIFYSSSIVRRKRYTDATPMQRRDVPMPCFRSTYLPILPSRSVRNSPVFMVRSWLRRFDGNARCHVGNNGSPLRAMSRLWFYKYILLRRCNSLIVRRLMLSSRCIDLQCLLVDVLLTFYYIS